MMEERVTNHTYFKVNREMLDRHRDRWLGGDLDHFLSGESFTSPIDDDQELSYHLAQLIVRGLLTRDAKAFFAFARACRESGPTEAAIDNLGAPLSELVEQALRANR